MAYKRSLFTFVDILGFSKLIDTSNDETIRSLLEELHRTVEVTGELAEMFEMEVLTFSDCTVRSVHIDSETNKKQRDGILFHELTDLASAQATIMCQGYLLRGGMTLGSILIDEKLVFGPALVRAYKLETEFATYPRIVIDPAVLKAFEEEPLLRNKNHSIQDERDYISKIFRRDSDGLYYVDYLKGCLGECEYDDLTVLGNHRDLIVDKSAEHNSLNSIAAKYLWLARYHNTVVNELGPDWFADRDDAIENYRIDAGEVPLMYELT